MKETVLRSWTKSLIWRLLGFIILGVIAYCMTGNLSESFKVSIVFNVIRFFLYVAHERIWQRIQWGTYD